MKRAGKAVSVLMAAVLAAGMSAPMTFAASPYVKSDTTMDFTVNKGNTYAFKFTVMGSHSNPQIAAGNGAVLQTESCRKVVEYGNDTYYFKVRAIGTPGQESAIYTTLPGQSGVRHCKIKVGVQHHKDGYKDGAAFYYYDGEDSNKSIMEYDVNGQLAASRKKQYLIDCMSYLGYTHNAGLDSANIWTTPTSKPYEGELTLDYEGDSNDTATEVEERLKATVKDLVEEMKKHKTTEYGVHTTPYIYEKQEEEVIPTFKSNLTYDTNPDPVFTSKYYNGFKEIHSTPEGGNMGCNEYVLGRAKEITGITLNDNFELYTANAEECEALKKIGYKIGTEPRKDAIAYEPKASLLGHYEYVESVDGDNVVLSGGNGKYKPGDGLYYGRVTRTKKNLSDWNTVYIYLK